MMKFHIAFDLMLVSVVCIIVGYKLITQKHDEALTLVTEAIILLNLLMAKISISLAYEHRQLQEQQRSLTAMEA
jgi:hypothetical protein